jgi:hypothetical protein
MQATGANARSTAAGRLDGRAGPFRPEKTVTAVQVLYDSLRVGPTILVLSGLGIGTRPAGHAAVGGRPLWTAWALPGTVTSGRPPTFVKCQLEMQFLVRRCTLGFKFLCLVCGNSVPASGAAEHSSESLADRLEVSSLIATYGYRDPDAVTRLCQSESRCAFQPGAPGPCPYWPVGRLCLR